MKKVEIYPSLLSANPLFFAQEIDTVKTAAIKGLHFDVMDGHYVPNLTIGPHILKSIKQYSQLTLDVHLMVSNPESTVDLYIDAGADMLCFHPEACHHPHRLLTHISDRGVKAGLALNPHTTVESIKWLLPVCDHILVMTVNPGFGGQKFITSILDKISQLKQTLDTINSKTLICVDGGVTSKNAGTLATAGADILVAGNAVFGETDRKAAIKKLSLATQTS